MSPSRSTRPAEEEVATDLRRRGDEGRRRGICRCSRRDPDEDPRIFTAFVDGVRRNRPRAARGGEGLVRRRGGWSRSARRPTWSGSWFRRRPGSWSRSGGRTRLRDAIGGRRSAQCPCSGSGRALVRRRFWPSPQSLSVAMAFPSPARCRSLRGSEVIFSGRRRDQGR